MGGHREFQHMVAEMMLAFEPIAPHLDLVAAEWSEGVDHGASWPAKIVGAKYRELSRRAGRSSIPRWNVRRRRNVSR